jgi:hypothetical protein
MQNILGLTDTNPPASPCVSTVDGSGNPLQENTGNLLTNDKQIEPYSVSAWIAQTTKAVPDVHGVTLLGNIDGVPSVAINGSVTGIRPVFNVVPNVLAQSTTNTQSVFVNLNRGTILPNTSVLCQNSATILQLGFLTRSDCGDPSIQSDTGLGTDTVGPGE